MIVAGVGCRRGASAAEIEAAIAAALTQARQASRLDAIASAAFKGNEPGIAAAAAARGVPLVLVAQSDLERVGNLATHSRRIFGLMGVGSVAEAAALAASGPDARLIVPRIVVGPATCAVASCGEAP